jgi:hypothetical protein
MNTKFQDVIVVSASDVFKSEMLVILVTKGRTVAQRLDAGFPPRRPGFTYGQHVGFVVDKAALG